MCSHTESSEFTAGKSSNRRSKKVEQPRGNNVFHPSAGRTVVN